MCVHYPLRPRGCARCVHYRCHLIRRNVRQCQTWRFSRVERWKRGSKDLQIRTLAPYLFAEIHQFRLTKADLRSGVSKNVGNLRGLQSIVQRDSDQSYLEARKVKLNHLDRVAPMKRQGLQPLGCEGSGSVQRGPSWVCGSGTLIMASGPALCSPLKGVNWSDHWLESHKLPHPADC